MRPYIDMCVPFQIMTSQLNLPQVDTSQSVETTQHDKEKWEEPELN